MIQKKHYRGEAAEVPSRQAEQEYGLVTASENTHGRRNRGAATNQGDQAGYTSQPRSRSAMDPYDPGASSGCKMPSTTVGHQSKEQLTMFSSQRKMPYQTLADLEPVGSNFSAVTLFAPVKRGQISRSSLEVFQKFKNLRRSAESQKNWLASAKKGESKPLIKDPSVDGKLLEGVIKIHSETINDIDKFDQRQEMR